jgi:p-aminobenzoyl-glutamate transporter AbgT
VVVVVVLLLLVVVVVAAAAGVVAGIAYHHHHNNHCVEIKGQLDATDEFFFIADLIACSTCFGHLYAHHQEL